MEACRLAGLVVALKNSTYVYLDEQFQERATGTYLGEPMVVTADESGQWVGVGTEDGDLFIGDLNGEIHYHAKQDVQITGIAFTGDVVYVTGFGNFVYEIKSSALAGIKFTGTLSTIVRKLTFIGPIFLCIIACFTFNPLRTRAHRFGQALSAHRTAYLMLIPTFSLLLVFNYYPAVTALTRSFTDWGVEHQSLREISFIGLDNFRRMISEGYFLLGLKNLGILLVTAFIKILSVPLLVAELVFAMKGNRQKFLYRFLFILPMAVPAIVTVLMWQNIYDPTIGLLNVFLQTVGLEGLTHVWLGEEKIAIWAIVFMGFPFVNAFAFLVYYGGLINISPSLFEAAKVDGSNAWWNFRQLHIPLLAPQFKMLIILTFILTVQDFSGIFILTSGGPGVSTYVPGLELFYNATRFGRYGYACALGLVMFLAILVGTLFNMRIKAEADLS